jgi:predicted MFS family arabinose efflux permease
LRLNFVERVIWTKQIGWKVKWMFSNFELATLSPEVPEAPSALNSGACGVADNRCASLASVVLQRYSYTSVVLLRP